MSKGVVGIKDVKAWLGEDLEAKFSFSVEGNYIKVKPKQFLGSETFSKAASIVREHGGEYISVGKDSHFRFERGVEREAADKVREAIDYLEKALTALREAGH